MKQDYTKWRRRLTGDFLPIDPNIPEQGVYRIRRGDMPGWDAVQIWQVLDEKTGEVQARAKRISLGSGALPILARTFAVRWQTVWPACAERPVSTIAFKQFEETGKWPDDVKTSSDINASGEPFNEAARAASNFAAAPEHERFLAEITALEAEAIAWFDLIGGVISKPEQADKAANYAREFLKWEQRATDAKKTAQKPAEQEIAVFEKEWKPVIVKAEDGKTAIRERWLRPWLLEQDRKRKEALATEARDPQTIMAKPKAGTAGSRASSIRTTWRGRVVDYRHFLIWLLSFETLSPHLLTAMDKIANEMVHARVKDIPGVAKEEEVTVV